LDGLASEQRRAIAERCLHALVEGCRDGEWVVRYAVVVGLESLAPAVHPELAEGPAAQQRLHDALIGLCRNPTEEAPVVQLRAALALQRLGVNHG
jgi:phycocyanobilin lyase beta subunit